MRKEHGYRVDEDFARFLLGIREGLPRPNIPMEVDCPAAGDDSRYVYTGNCRMVHPAATSGHGFHQRKYKIPSKYTIFVKSMISVRERSYIRNVSYLRNHDARVPELRNLVGFLN
jgi:hypothetical protein